MPSKRRQNMAIVVLILAFIILSLAYSIVNPLHEATDELRHYRFVQHIVQRGTLPVQGEGGCSAQGHHPPLYYAAAALATSWIDTGQDVCYEPPLNPFWAYHYWDVGVDNKNQYMHGEDEAFPWTGAALAAHLSRMVNILIGAGVVLVTYLIGRAIWPQRLYLAFGGAAIVAFNPMFLFMAGAINNDVIAALAGAAVTLAAVRLLRDEEGLRWQWGLVFGLLYGLALLSKFNLAAIIVSIELAISWVAWRKKQWRQWLYVNLLIVIAALLVAGWWFLRNQILYGEPTGVQRLTELWGVRDPSESFSLALIELPYVWTSLWGRFGYGQIPLPSIIYVLLGIFAIVSLSGLLLPIVRREKEELRSVGPCLLLLLVNVGLFFGVIFNYLLISPAGPMGRFFFPALPSLALLMVYGLSRWMILLMPRDSAVEEVRGRSRGAILAGLVSGGLLVISLIALFGYLRPAYARPQGYARTNLPNESDISFEGFVTLRGYEINRDSVRPGEELEVTLYWEVTAEPPGDYLEFVHFIDEDGFMIAQRDTHPGLGRFPASQWQVGDRFQENVLVEIPDMAYTPASGEISVGFYAPSEGYRLGVYGPDGSLLGDNLPLGKVELAPAEAAAGIESMIPNPMLKNFGNELLLRGYMYDRRELSPGESLGVTLYWEPLEGEREDYTIQLRLLNEQGAVIQTQQERPHAGSTSAWPAGEIVSDRFDIPLSNEIDPGLYPVQLALERVGDEKRAVIFDEDGRWLSDKLRLSPIRVGP
jgi:4-amino-4-deoxy-L-arabinose transferase-like glycosyltransferase